MLRNNLADKVVNIYHNSFVSE